MVLRDPAPGLIRFGQFLLEPQRRLLSLDAAPVPLSSRAFDILLLLVEHRDRIVTKDEIFAAVWPGLVVEDNNLAVQISALRRALREQSGDPRFIMTVPGRGYRFVAPVTEEAAPAAETAEAAAVSPVVEPAALAGRRRWPLVAGALIIGLLVVFVARSVLRDMHVAPRLSIAVLPFRNLSADRQQDYLADAITDDLTTDLSHIPGSTVIARGSADAYKGRAVAASEIGRALNVRYLLEGSLRIEGDTFHINAQLIDATTGGHIRGDRFDVTRDKLGLVQEQIVRHIASALDFTLVQVEAARSLHERPNNPDAVDLYFRARSVLDDATTLDGLMKAQGLLERAVALSPDFGDALAELGIVLVNKTGNFDDVDEQRDVARAEMVISRAMAIAPRSPLVITANGMLAWGNRRCEQAQPSFRLALSLDPNNVEAKNGLARCSRALGHMEQMIADLQDILRIDPVGARNASREHLIGMGYLMLGQPREAVDWLERAGASIVDSPEAETTLGWREWRQIYLIAAIQLAGNATEAARLYADYARSHPNRTVAQLASYDTHAQAQTKGYAAYLAALGSAGMPGVIREDADFHVAPTQAAGSGGDFDPTPLHLPEASSVLTGEMFAMLQKTTPPVVLDLGLGAMVIPGAIWVWSPESPGDCEHLLKQAGVGADSERPIVVMSDGPLGWRSYNAALSLVAKGFRHVLWYRGGEAAWSAAGHAWQDRRSP